MTIRRDLRRSHGEDATHLLRCKHEDYGQSFVLDTESSRPQSGSSEDLPRYAKIFRFRRVQNFSATCGESFDRFLHITQPSSRIRHVPDHMQSSVRSWHRCLGLVTPSLRPRMLPHPQSHRRPPLLPARHVETRNVRYVDMS